MTSSKLLWEQFCAPTRFTFVYKYTSSINQYVRQNWVLDYTSRLRTSKIMFHVGFRIKYLYYVGQSCGLLKLMVQIYKMHYVKNCVKMYFGNLFTMTLRQILRPKLLFAFFNTSCSNLCCKCKSFHSGPGSRQKLLGRNSGVEVRGHLRILRTDSKVPRRGASCRALFRGHRLQFRLVRMASMPAVIPI